MCRSKHAREAVPRLGRPHLARRKGRARDSAPARGRGTDACSALEWPRSWSDHRRELPFDGRQLGLVRGSADSRRARRYAVTARRRLRDRRSDLRGSEPRTIPTSTTGRMPLFGVDLDRGYRLNRLNRLGGRRRPIRRGLPPLTAASSRTQRRGMPRAARNRALADWTPDAGPLEAWSAAFMADGWRHEFNDDKEGVEVVKNGRTLRRFALVTDQDPQHTTPRS